MKILGYFIFVGLTFVTLANVQAAPNQLTETGSSLSIQVCIEMWSEDSRITAAQLSETVGQWQTWANEFWGTPSALFDGKPVHIEYRLFVGREQAFPKECHNVEVTFGQPASSGEYSAYIAQNENPQGPHTGGIPIQVPQRTLVHEFGHILNLDDEYAGILATEKPAARLAVNGQTLIPIDRKVIGDYANVSYGPTRGQTGIMSYTGMTLFPYYIQFIVEKLR